MPDDQFVRYDYAWKTSGWNSQNPTLTLSGTETYVDPGLPADVSKVLVSGKFLDHLTGRPLEGVIQVRTGEILTYNPTNTQVMPGVRRLRFRSGGFSILLPATDDPQLTPTDNSWSYQFRLTVNGITQEFTSILPASPAEVDIIKLTRARVVKTLATTWKVLVV